MTRPNPNRPPDPLRMFGTVDARVVRIDPATAKVMLSHNRKNRGVRPATVNAYARDMREGRWTMTGEAVKFDTNGDLADGQHRLAAIVKADVPVDLLVIWGVPPEAQDVMDSGMKRSAYDVYMMRGVKHATLLTSVARFALMQDGIVRPTTAEVHEWIAKNPAVHGACDAASAFANQIDIPKSVTGYAWFVLSDVDMVACGEFFNSIAHARTHGEGDPRYALLTRLRTIKRMNQAPSQAAYLSLLFRSWNAWRQGRSIRAFPLESREGPIPVPRPI